MHNVLKSYIGVPMRLFCYYCACLLILIFSTAHSYADIDISSPLYSNNSTGYDDGVSRYEDGTHYYYVPWGQIQRPAVVAVFPQFGTSQEKEAIKEARNSRTAINKERDGHYALVGFDSGTIAVLNLQLLEVYRVKRDCDILSGHTDSINSIAITPDAKKAISASRDGTVKIWDLNTCSQLMSNADGFIPSSVVVTPDGRRAVSVSASAKMYIWDMVDNRLERAIQSDSSLVSVAAMPDNRHVVSAEQNILKVWDIQDGSLKRKFQQPYSIKSVTVSADGSQLAAVFNGFNTIHVVDTETAKTKDFSIGRSFQNISFTFEQNRLVTDSGVGGLNNLYIWDTTSGKHRAIINGYFNHPGSVYRSKRPHPISELVGFSLSGDKRYLAAIGSGSPGYDGDKKNTKRIMIIDLKTGLFIRSVRIESRTSTR